MGAQRDRSADKNHPTRQFVWDLWREDQVVPQNTMGEQKESICFIGGGRIPKSTTSEDQVAQGIEKLKEW